MVTYQPREDSEFLARFVKEHARGAVLDMGTGSGIQAITALENTGVQRVTALDINPAAVRALKVARPDLDVRESDLFAAVQDERFDTIICNPPYLPDEQRDVDPALYGGPHGWEFTVRFLKEAKPHLAPGGQILLLFSSLTNKERVDQELRALGYIAEELGMLAMFFERLYVYKVLLP